MIKIVLQLLFEIQILNRLLYTLYPSELLAYKGVFFSESEIRFSNLQISPPKLFQITILNLKFLPITVNSLFKF